MVFFGLIFNSHQKGKRGSKHSRCTGSTLPRFPPYIFVPQSAPAPHSSTSEADCSAFPPGIDIRGRLQRFPSWHRHQRQTAALSLLASTSAPPAGRTALWAEPPGPAERKLRRAYLPELVLINSGIYIILDSSSLCSSF